MPIEGPGFNFTVAPSSFGQVTILHGAGSPTASPSTTAALYYDDNDASILYRWNAVTEVWEQFAFSGGTSQQVFSFAGDPNGNVTAPVVPALCIDTTTGNVYQKTSSPGTNTGWV